MPRGMLVAVDTLCSPVKYILKFCCFPLSLGAQHVLELTGPPLHRMKCSNSRSLSVGLSSRPALFLSPSLLHLPPPACLSFSPVFWQRCSPCITKPVLSACPIVLRTSQVMINTNTQQWELRQPTSMGVDGLKVGASRHSHQ